MAGRPWNLAEYKKERAKSFVDYFAVDCEYFHLPVFVSFVQVVCLQVHLPVSRTKGASYFYTFQIDPEVSIGPSLMLLPGDAVLSLNSLDRQLVP